MQPSAAVANLGAGDHRQPVTITGGRGRAASALRDILVDLAVLILARPEPLDRGHDHARIDLLDPLPAETHPVQCAGGEILDQHIAFLDQPGQHLLASLGLRVQLDRALVVVQHGEIQAVSPRHIDQLLARCIANPRPLDLDHIRAEPRQKLGAGRTRLNMGKVKNLDAFECFHCVPLLVRN